MPKKSKIHLWIILLILNSSFVIPGNATEKAGVNQNSPSPSSNYSTLSKQSKRGWRLPNLLGPLKYAFLVAAFLARPTGNVGESGTATQLQLDEPAPLKIAPDTGSCINQVASTFPLPVSGTDLGSLVQVPDGMVQLLDGIEITPPSPTAEEPLKEMFRDSPVSKEEFEAIKLVSEYFKKLCPPKECVILGIGRSPTPFIAFLEGEATDYVYSVPLSNFRYGLPYDSEVSNFKESPTYRELSLDEKEKLFDHFSKYLPNPTSLGSRKVLVIDYASGGESLLAAKRYVEEYFKRRNSNTIVDAAAVTEDYASRVRLPEVQHIAILLNYHKLGDVLNKQRYDNYSPFGSFELTSGKIEKLEKRKEYLEFSAAIAKLKLDDRKLLKSLNDQEKEFETAIIFTEDSLLPLDLPYGDLTHENKVHLSIAVPRLRASDQRTRLHFKLLKDDNSQVREKACKAINSYDVKSEKTFYQIAMNDKTLYWCLVKTLPRYQGDKFVQLNYFEKLINQPDSDVRKLVLTSVVRAYKFRNKDRTTSIEIRKFLSIAIHSKYEDIRKIASKIAECFSSAAGENENFPFPNVECDQYTSENIED